MIDLIGGPDRDRTDDLFHAMVGMNLQIIVGMMFMSRLVGKNGIIGAICCQFAAKFTQRAKGPIVWDRPKLFYRHSKLRFRNAEVQDSNSQPNVFSITCRSADDT